MLKKKQKSNASLSIRSSKPHNCTLCQNKCQRQELVWVANDSLSKKYSTSHVDYTATSEFNEFIQSLSIGYSGGITQFQQYFTVRQYLKQYMDIAKTRSQITQLVRREAQRPCNPVIHFYGPIHNILKLRALIKNRKAKSQEKNGNPQNKLSVNHSFIKAKQIKNIHHNKAIKKSKSGNKILTKKHLKDINQSYFQMQNLCKKIGIMCDKILTRKSNCFQKQKLTRKKQKIQFQKYFKSNLQPNFSIIKSKQSPSKQKSKNSKRRLCTDKAEDIYGLSQRKQLKKNKSASQRTHTNNRVSTQKIQAIPDTPVSRAYYPKQYYTQTQKLDHKTSSNKLVRAYVRQFKSNLRKNSAEKSTKKKDAKSLNSKKLINY